MQQYQRWIDSGGELPFPGGESRQELCRTAAVSALLKSVATEQLKKGRAFSGVRCTWRYDHGGDGAVLLR